MINAEKELYRCDVCFESADGELHRSEGVIQCLYGSKESMIGCQERDCGNYEEVSSGSKVCEAGAGRVRK